MVDCAWRRVAASATALMLVCSVPAQQQYQNLPAPLPPTTGQVFAAQEHIYETLFNNPWNLNNSYYRLNAVHWGGVGTLTGQNDLGQSFSLDVTWGELINYTQLGLDPATVGGLVSKGVLSSKIEATISTQLASFRIQGRTLAYVDTAGTVQSQLLIGYYFDTGPQASPSSGSVPTPGNSQGEPPVPPVGGKWKFETICYTTSWPCVAQTPECNQCAFDYSNDLAEIQNEYAFQKNQFDTQLSSAQQGHNTCRASAQTDFLKTEAKIDTLYFIAIAVCAFAFPPFSVPCCVGATATATVERIDNALDYAIATKACDAALINARNQYRANMEALNAWLNSELARIQQALQNCWGSNNCFTSCTITICYVIWEFCPD